MAAWGPPISHRRGAKLRYGDEWKLRVREDCLQRVRAGRQELLWASRAGAEAGATGAPGADCAGPSGNGHGAGNSAHLDTAAASASLRAQLRGIISEELGRAAAASEADSGASSSNSRRPLSVHEQSCAGRALGGALLTSAPGPMDDDECMHHAEMWDDLPPAAPRSSSAGVALGARGPSFPAGSAFGGTGPPGGPYGSEALAAQAGVAGNASRPRVVAEVDGSHVARLSGVEFETLMLQLEEELYASLAAEAAAGAGAGGDVHMGDGRGGGQGAGGPCCEEEEAEHDSRALRAALEGVFDDDDSPACNPSCSPRGEGEAREEARVLCPVCRRRDLRQDAAVIHCGCGFGLNVRAETLNLSFLRGRLEACFDAHRAAGCGAEPAFGLQEAFGARLLMMTCVTCGALEAVI